MRLYISNAADRDAVVVILARNGYTVRNGTEKKAGDKRSKSFVEVISNDGNTTPDCTH
jgi:hypothetical protein